MNFWESQAGYDLAQCLSDKLPSILESLNRQQYCVECKNSEDAMEYVEERIAVGDRYINHIESNGKFLLILERK